MGLRATTAFAVFFIGLAGSASPALAQYYPAPAPAYPPGVYRPPLPAVVAEDDDMPAYDPAPSRRAAPGIYPAPPGVYAAPGVYEAPLPADPRYARPAPPSDVDPNGPPPGTRYGRAAPVSPEMDGYVPAPPPGYISPPGYVTPPPGYEPVEPRQGYAQPAPPGQVNGVYEIQSAKPPVLVGPPRGAPYPAQSEPAPGTSYELQEAVRPPLPLSPGQQVAPGRETTGTVRGDPRTVIASLPAEDRPETGPRKELPPQFRRAMVEYRTKEPAGTIIIDTPSTYLYLVMGNGKALRYGVGVGRDGFTWNGVQKVTRMAEWPDWHPPEEMIERQPYLPRFMAGGDGNPLGARALYLGSTVYRIHGTNQPSTIGSFVSSGCIRLTNEDVEDLYTRVKVGTRVVVLPGGRPPATASAMPPVNSSRPAPLPPPVQVR